MPIKAKMHAPPAYIRRYQEADRQQRKSAWVYGGRWRRLRKAWLSAEPRTCRDCGTPYGLQVHHTVPHRGNLDLAYDPSNLEALCVRCHSVHHNGMRRHGKVDKVGRGG